MSLERIAGFENEWIVLDKIIAGAVGWAWRTPNSMYKSDTEITLTLADYEHSCGFTKEVSSNLMSRPNYQNRKRMSDLGINFVNCKQSWDKRKIVVRYEEQQPNLYQLFGSIHEEHIATPTNVPSLVPVVSAPAHVLPIITPTPILTVYDAIELSGQDKIVTVKSRNNKKKKLVVFPPGTGSCQVRHIPQD
jgi:hypothetical protein